MFDSWTTDKFHLPPHVFSVPLSVMLRFRHTSERGIDRVERDGVNSVGREG